MKGKANRSGDIYLDPIIDPFYPRFWPERLKQVTKHKKPAGIFLDDMSDWMGDYWPAEWTEQEIQMMRDTPQHRFYTLTKQPQNLIKISPFPDNCWVGVTATDTKMFVNACKYLRGVTATVKYISFEPLLDWREPVLKYTEPVFGTDISTRLSTLDISWCIIGAQTHPTVWPNRYWMAEIIDACDKSNIPVFLKDNLKILVNDDYRQAGRFNFWTPKAELRQEMPKHSFENR